MITDRDIASYITDDLDALGVPMYLRHIGPDGAVDLWAECETHEHCEICRIANELRADAADAPDGWSSVSTEKVYGQPCPRCGNNDPQGTHRFIGPRKRVTYFVADEEALPPAGRFRFWMSKNAERHLMEKEEAKQRLAANLEAAKQQKPAEPLRVERGGAKRVKRTNTTALRSA